MYPRLGLVKFNLISLGLADLVVCISYYSFICKCNFSVIIQFVLGLSMVDFVPALGVTRMCNQVVVCV